MTRSYDENQYNDLMQVKMSIKAAERAVGHATESLDEDQLEAASNAVRFAKQQYQQAFTHQTGRFSFSRGFRRLIENIDHQLKEAKKEIK
ncbi:DUF2564 family protein [Thalassobacillus sp. C254]|uniref:DUF2564 family protein n=1 Tax=Thalassobacillus sp. C254 TaxID=1225341 RepID=UPI0006D2797A|nr:DUF2564 family protein [Thalassobacillus sp. C254]